MEAATKINDDNETFTSQNSQKRCEICPREYNRKTRNKCSRCDGFFCGKHAWKLYICITCYNDIQKSNKQESAVTNDPPSLNLRSRNRNLTL
ncbi:unnamed protein product [Brachionus calyciflorus]|uniref:Uncharacterized protein n=1 Tax=Brachionus calyciflorus TaxID=104777 RepID=A0A813VW61_9BILA|nr:unnamed protein product [Brachionus calyciflorus]